MLVEVGNIVEGKVSGITSFGAFIQLPGGKVGLVHISEVADEYVKDVKSHLKENQSVKVKILSVDNNGKISLSIKKAMEKKPEVRQQRKLDDYEWGRNNTETMSFEDRLSKFMKDSDEKMHDLKKSFDSKRGGGSYKKSAQYY